MKIHILSDDKVRRRGVLAEHGLSILIEHDNDSLLFDTGQSDVYVQNAREMGLDLERVSRIVLSHGHYDHCGGLMHFPKTTIHPRVYAHRDAFVQKYARNDDGSYREIGIPWSVDESETIKQNLVLTNGITMVAHNMALLGDIPDSTGFEDIAKGLYTGDETNKSKDMFQDEQMLIINTNEGLCIFLGCSHPGVINGVKAAKTLFPGTTVHALFAGMHLENAGPIRLQMTMQAMVDMNIRHIYPLHCTGLFAICEMQRFFAERCKVLYAGDSVEL